MKQVILLAFSLVSLQVNSQVDSLITDPILYLNEISKPLFGSDCADFPDTVNYDVPRPLDNDDLMMEAFGDYLTQRYGLVGTDYGIWVMFSDQLNGKPMKDIWVQIGMKESAINDNEEYYRNTTFIIPLCAVEQLYRSSGSESIIEELDKVVDVTIAYNKQLYQINLENETK